ncbi:hypothetical protein BH23ACT9_BH23ACT9_14120 [soil metagenome]
MRSRTLINLVTVIIASVVLVLFAVTQLLATAILDNNYPLFIELSEAGGLLENKQVTYRGVAIGEVIDVTLCDDPDVASGPECTDVENVRVEMGINNDVAVPRGVEVVVLRQSAVGEQALDIRPVAATGPSTRFYEEGDVIEPGSVVLPTKTQELLELANRVFGPVDEENAAIVVRELADAFRGRSTDLQRILVDSAVLSEAVADNGTDYDRLFAASRIVNATLADNREVLAELLVDLADGAQLIGDIRGEIDGLLTTAPPVLAATTSLLDRGDANLACIIRDLADVNEFTAQPENLNNFAEGLRTYEFFFGAFRILGPLSALGDPWLRVELIGEPVPPAQLYTPPRPIPPTLPGGACESVFGPGAGAAFQDSHRLVAPESQIIRPENDRRSPLPGVAPVTSLTAAGEVPVTVQPPVAVAVTTDVAAVEPTSPLVGLLLTLAMLLMAASSRMVRHRASSAGPVRLPNLRWPGSGGRADG